MKFMNRVDKNAPWSNENCSFQKLANGDGNLDLIYQQQFFKNDVSENPWGGLKTVHRTFNVPIPMTLAGTIYLNGEVAHTFFMDRDRKIVLYLESLNKYSPVIFLDGQGYDTGIIVMNWNRPVEPNEVRLVMGYEYDISDELNEIHFNT